MTKVTKLLVWIWMIFGSAGILSAGTLDAEALYSQLGNVGLDPARVYEVRGTQFNRGAIQISLDAGTIAFTQDVVGRVTGAFFEGDGEVLLVPPDQAERSSMALFTGAAILEEHFVSGYFRFNDDTFNQLQPTLRPADNPQDFVSQWNQTAKNLAGGDSLRLLLSFSRFLPTSEGAQPDVKAQEPPNDDRILHARLQGRKLGTFDLYFDAAAAEQIWAGQLKTANGANFYDVWTSFSLPEPGAHRTVNGITAEEGKTDTVVVSQYKIRAEIAPPTTLNADATLQMEVRQGGQRAALFELSRFLQIKTLEADGHAVEFIHNQALEGTQLARRGNDLVAIIFPQPLRTGQKIQMHFVYGGEVLSEAGGGLLYVGARGTWYPNRGLAMADFDLEFHYPPGWTLLATGKHVDDSSARPAEALQSSRWVSDRPIPLAGFNLGRYSRASAHAGGISVDTYAASSLERTFPRPPAQAQATLPDFSNPTHRRQTVILTPAPLPSPVQNAQPLADHAAQAVDFFAQHFGPYPYSQLALTQMPGDLSQGWPGLIFLSSISFLTPQELAQLHMTEVDAVLSQLVVTHETAHQWWGDLVVWSEYRDQWLVEALANYSALMMLEAQDPKKFRLVMDKYRNDLLQKDKEGVASLEAGPVTLGSRLSNSRFPNGYDEISYGRGTWLIHMLRCMLRDGEKSTNPTSEPIFRVLNKVRDRYQGRAITTRELLDVFAEDLPPSLRYEGQKSLAWFYEGWISGTAVPRFEVQAVKYLDKGQGTVVSGTILQKSAPKDLVTSVPVFAYINGKSLSLGRVFAEGPETPFHLNAPLGARRVVLDPEQTLLARVK